MAWSKEEFLDQVESNWYLGRCSKITVDWAVGENEIIECDYLSEKGRDGDNYPFEDHLIVTDRRILNSKVRYDEIKYSTLFFSQISGGSHK